MNNVFAIPFDDLAELDEAETKQNHKKAVEDFMLEITQWCEEQGIDTSTIEYRHQGAVIMAVLQGLLLGVK